MRWLTIAAALVLVATACSNDGSEAATTSSLPATTTTTTRPTTTTTTTTLVTRPIPIQPLPDPQPPQPGQPVPAGTVGALIVAEGGAEVAPAPAGAATVVAHQGLVFPVTGHRDGWFQVVTQCNDEAWMPTAKAEFIPAGGGASVGAGLDFSDAIIVLDPGHGGPNIGAVGPVLELEEKEVNLDIARRARDLLNDSHTVDWESGVLYAGDAIPPAAQVWVTRQEGPPGADIETGLEFRTALANNLNAHALVSIHNNASPEGPSAASGAEVYYRNLDGESQRLAGLMLEELRRSFAAFDVPWVANSDAGAKYRLREDGREVYGILRRAEVPAIIAEGAFISTPEEEALLATPQFRQAYAEAVYRALVRFITTDDPGSGFVATEPFTGNPGSGAPQSTCAIPAQP